MWMIPREKVESRSIESFNDNYSQKTKTEPVMINHHRFGSVLQIYPLQRFAI